MMNKCYNGGINYLQDTTLFNDCFGYDFKSFYPSILANDKLDFKFPVKKGHRIFLIILMKLKNYIEQKN